MPKAVMWDVGGVLLRKVPPGDRWRRQHWADGLGLSLDELHESVWAAMGARGAAQTDVIVEGLCSRLDLTHRNADQLLWDFHAHWQADEQLLDFAVATSSALITGILSNAHETVRWGFESILGLDHFSKDIVISASVGFEKPHPKIYELALDRLHVEPSDVLFVDDRPDNVQAALDLGINAHIHVDAATTIDWVEEQMQ